MNEISDGDLSQVSAQSGINFVIGNSQLLITADSFQLSDTESVPNWLKFNDIRIDDGNGGYFTLDTPDPYYGGNLNICTGNWNTLDIVTDQFNKTRVALNLSMDVYPRTYTIGHFVFGDRDLGDVDLGSIVIDKVRHGANDSYVIGGRLAGSGIDLEYKTDITIDAFKWTYNDSLDSLNFSGIHLAGAVSGDAEDPTTWGFSGKFKIGDLTTDNPMTMDCGTWTDGTTTGTSVFLNIPMTGSIRMGNVQFGANQFGPVAIDGIKVHHLYIAAPGIGN